MKSPWKIKDLIDLEYFLARKFNDPDEGKASDNRDLDRQAFLSFDTAGKSVDDPSTRKRLIRHWLEMRREQEGKDQGEAALLPGTLFSESMGIVRLTTIFAALILGAGLTWGLMSYQGRQPINVFTCLWVLLAPQVALLIVLAISAVLVRMKMATSFKLFYPLFTTLIHGLLRKITHFAVKKMDAKKANRIRETYSLLGRTGTIYGSVFFWPIFLLAQAFGIFYNTGILVTLFIRVAITDLAFGWQTTLQMAPAAVYRFVEIVSWPWSWLFSPPVAHPTIEQVAGTQMVLKEGIIHLATGDLVAWWPFIFLAVLFYGLVPRLILAGVGFLMKRRALASIDFSHSACDRLVLRMQTRHLDTKSKPYQPAKSRRTPVREEPSDRRGDTAASAILLVPVDLIDHLNGLNKILEESLYIKPATTIPMETDTAADSSRLRKALIENQDGSMSLRVVVLQEAWQPPIKETISWIKDLRAAAGGTLGMVIFLIGRPGPETFLTPPSEVDRKVWEQAVNTLKDPYLRIEALQGDSR